jgi:DNA repair exonuclease SbcCD nuclease subunit
VIRLLHLADVHLGAAYSGFEPIAENRRDEVLTAFRGLPDVAVAEDVHAVLVCGDLFDGPRPSERCLAVTRQVSRRFQEAGLPIFAIPGNHDSAVLNPSLYEDALPGAEVFSEPVFCPPRTVETRGGPLHVYGIAADRALSSDPLGSFRRSDQPGVHVVLLHGALQDAPHWGEPSSLSLLPERLAEIHADYLALGDYHRFRSPAEFKQAPACYAGSFAAVDIAEDGAKGFVIAEVGAAAPPAVRHVSSGVREVKRLGEVDISTCADELAVVEMLGERAPEGCIPFVQLIGEPAFPLDSQKVRTNLEERFGCVRIEDATRFFASTRLAEIAQERTIAGHVARLGQRRLEETQDPERRLER